MAAVTANQVIKRRNGHRRSVSVAASTTIYEGTFVFVTAAGYGTGAIASGANVYAGVAVETVDNSSGSNGEKTVEVICDKNCEFELTLGSAAIADIGDTVYATDNFTITKTSTSNSAMGVITEYIGTNTVLVRHTPL